MLSLRPSPNNWLSLDLSHAALIMGVVAAKKPEQVLELGFGIGYGTDAIVQALTWNRKGRLTVVDNWYDWQGREPDTTAPFKQRGVEFVVGSEEDFVRSAADEKYDVLVSDADHLNSHKWLDQHLRIVRPGGVLFFHDVGPGSLFPNLRQIVRDAKAMGLSHQLFAEDTRSDEYCHRGLLMVHKPESVMTH
jgi:predicted O-methyltransferase YrrM